MQPRAKVLNERFGDAAGQEQYDLGTTIIRIVCQLLGPSTPFPAFGVPLGLVPVKTGFIGHFNSLQMYAVFVKFLHTIHSRTVFVKFLDSFEYKSFTDIAIGQTDHTDSFIGR